MFKCIKSYIFISAIICLCHCGLTVNTSMAQSLCEYRTQFISQDLGKKIAKTGVKYVLKCVYELTGKCRMVWFAVGNIVLERAAQGRHMCWTKMCMVYRGTPATLVVLPGYFNDSYTNGTPYTPPQQFYVPATDPYVAERCYKYEDHLLVTFQSGYKCYVPYDCYLGWQ